MQFTVVMRGANGRCKQQCSSLESITAESWNRESSFLQEIFFPHICHVVSESTTAEFDPEGNRQRPV